MSRYTISVDCVFACIYICCDTYQDAYQTANADVLIQSLTSLCVQTMPAAPGNLAVWTTIPLVISYHRTPHSGQSTTTGTNSLDADVASPPLSSASQALLSETGSVSCSMISPMAAGEGGAALDVVGSSVNIPPVSPAATRQNTSTPAVVISPLGVVISTPLLYIYCGMPTAPQSSAAWLVLLPVNCGMAEGQHS